MSILDKKWVLVLNKIWQPIGYISIKQAVVSLFSSGNDNLPAKALDLEYEIDENGHVDFMQPTKIMDVGVPEWLDLPIRDFDIPIHTSNRVIRAPIVLITSNYSKMNYKRLRPTKKNLYEFYGGKCVWTGKILSLSAASIEHMTCKSANGDDTWQNLAISDKKLNSERGNTPLEKWKYKPKYALKEPKALPISALINKAARPEWGYFLINKN